MIFNVPILVISAHNDDLEINCSPFIEKYILNQYVIFATKDGMLASERSKNDLNILGKWKYNHLLYGNYNNTKHIISDLHKFIEEIGDVIILTHHEDEPHSDHEYTFKIAKSISRHPNVKGLVSWIPEYEEKFCLPYNLIMKISDLIKSKIILTLQNNYKKMLDYDFNELSQTWEEKSIKKSGRIINSIKLINKQYYNINFLEL